MQKKLLCSLITGLLFSTSSMAANISNNLKIDTYGKVGGYYDDYTDLFYHEDSLISM